MAKRRKTSSRAVRRKSSSRRSQVLVEVKASVLREIWAVIHLALGVFTLLSLQNNFGLVGEFWMGFLRPVFGWGASVTPAFFFGCSLMLFFSKKVHFPLSRLMGIFLLVVSVLSVLHLYVPMDSIYSEAQAGERGGYIGFVMNFLFRQVLAIGYLGASAVFLMFFLIGTLLTFEISLGALFRAMNPQISIVRKHERRGSTANEDEEELVEESEESDTLEEEHGPETEPTEEDYNRERFRALQDDADVVMIRRPNAVADDHDEASHEHVIQIQDGDEEPGTGGAATSGSGSQAVADEEYVWEPPSLDLLHPAVPDVALDDGLLRENAKVIRSKLKQFGIEVEMHEVHVGPTVIQYTLRPSEGIKLSKITTLKNDLALALAAKAIRIEAPIPGKSLVGIEVPNDHRGVVHLRELMESKEFEETAPGLRLPLGRDVSGKPVCASLSDMPHLLVAGATGSGKSVGMNTFLLSLLYQNSPADLKLIMIDPKRVELNSYNGIPHLLTPVITDPEKAAIALRWAVAEMNRRYQTLSEKRFRNIAEWNEEAARQEVLPPAEGGEAGADRLPKMSKIVVVIDELADLMMAAGKEVEASICRIAQMARAVGIHLIVATQRPSVDVITGLIKANIPTRIAFAVSSSIDSRTILDGTGAEDLLGKGDMLYLPGGMSKPLRIQGIFVSSQEIEKVTLHIKMSSPPNYVDDIISPRTAQQKVQGIPQSAFGDDDDDDSMYQQALGVVLETRKASASLLQRRLKLGYARAARLLDMMEEKGVIGPVNGAKPREIYMD